MRGSMSNTPEAAERYRSLYGDELPDIDAPETETDEEATNTHANPFDGALEAEEFCGHRCVAARAIHQNIYTPQ